MDGDKKLLLTKPMKACFAKRKIHISLFVSSLAFKDKKYMNVAPDKAFSEIRPIIDEVKKFNGVVTVLWHTTLTPCQKSLEKTILIVCRGPSESSTASLVEYAISQTHFLLQSAK